MNMKAILILFSICLFSCAFGQKSPDELKGDKLYNIFAYSKAIEKYEEAKSLTTEGLRRLADAYSKLNYYGISILMYRQLMEREDLISDDYFNFANILKVNNRYEEADVWMKKYYESAPDETRAKNNVAVMNQTSTLRVDRGFFKVENLGINSEKQEFGPSMYYDQLVYSANGPKRGMIVKKYTWSNETFLDLFIVDTSKLSEPSTNELARKFNKKYHEGTLSFTGDYQRMYFTANNYESKAQDGTLKLQLYFSDMNELNEWGDQQSFQYNSPEYSIGHPHISQDGKTLYFSSDMPGGYGGVDLYSCTMEKDSTWSKPVNLGPTINTEGDEMFPYFNEEKQILFFSSNGHFGLGGLDIYACSFKKGVYGKINNFGYPLNSSYDDFGIVFNKQLKQGYYSSNRIDGKGGDDIYSIALLKELVLEEHMKTIKGVVTDQDGLTLVNTEVIIFADGVTPVDTVLTDSTGSYTFKVFPDHNYTLVGQKEPYVSDTNFIAEDSKKLIVSSNLILEKLREDPKLMTVDNVLFLSVQTIYFDLNSSDLRPDTKENLDHVVQVMNDYPFLEIELGSHTDCRATKSYNNRLSQARAESSAEYIKTRISNPERIHGKGYGETQLTNGCSCEGKVVSTCTDEEHQANRRTEFKIIEQ
jgi:outer membrane protein OmpA-like peptidoglycan-associated protein/tetratricopeptide (TPR) repeat protein